MPIYRGSSEVDAAYRGDAAVSRIYRGGDLVWISPQLHQPVANDATTLFSAHSFLLTAMFPISGYDHGGILDDLRTGSFLYTFLPGSSEMARWNEQGPEITATGNYRLFVALFGSETTGLWVPSSTEGQDQYQALYYYCKDAYNKGRDEVALWAPWAGGSNNFDADTSARSMRIKVTLEAWIPGLKVSILPAHLLVRDAIDYMAANSLGTPYSGDNFHLDETGDTPSALSHMIQSWLSVTPPAVDGGDSALLAYLKTRAWYWLTHWQPCGMGGTITVTPHADTTPIVTPLEPPSSGGATTPAQPATPSISAIGEDTATVSWTAPSDGGSAITSYTLEWREVGGSTNTITGATSPEILASLTAATDHEARVTAINAIGSSTPSTWATFTTSTAAGLTPIAEITPTSYTGPALSSGAIPAAFGGYRTFTPGASTPAASLPVAADSEVYMIAAVRSSSFSNLVYMLTLQNGAYGTWPGVAMVAYGAAGDWVGGMVDDTFADTNVLSGQGMSGGWQVVEVWSIGGTVYISVDGSTVASSSTAGSTTWTATTLHLFRDESSGGHTIDLAAMRIFDEVPADRAAQRAWAAGLTP